MGKQSYDSIEELIADLENDIQNKVKPQIEKEMRNIMKDMIYEVVYSAYEPSYYSRRYANGGLMDDKNIEITANYSNGVLEISMKNVTKGNTKYSNDFPKSNTSGSIADLIETGSYETLSLSTYIGERPFQQKTIDKIEESGIIERIIEKALSDWF